MSGHKERITCQVREVTHDFAAADEPVPGGYWEYYVAAPEIAAALDFAFGIASRPCFLQSACAIPAVGLLEDCGIVQTGYELHADFQAATPEND